MQKAIIPIIGVVLFYFLWQNPTSQLAIKAVTQIECDNSANARLSHLQTDFDSLMSIHKRLLATNKQLHRDCKKLSQSVDTLLLVKLDTLNQVDSTWLQNWLDTQVEWQELAVINARLAKSLANSDALADYLANRDYTQDSTDYPIIEKARLKNSVFGLIGVTAMEKQPMYGAGYKRWLSESIAIGAYGTYQTKPGVGFIFEARFK